MRGVPDRASEPGMGEELLVVVVEADLVPVQLAASSESRAGVLLSMGLALEEGEVCMWHRVQVILGSHPLVCYRMAPT